MKKETNSFRNIKQLKFRKPSVKEEVEYKTDDIHILSLAKYG